MASGSGGRAAAMTLKSASGEKRSVVEIKGPRNYKRDLQRARNTLILVGLKTRFFTFKPSKLHGKRQTLNHRVSSSSPGAPTKPFKIFALRQKRNVQTSLHLGLQFLFTDFA
jgi:hypothetical protein